MMHCEHFAQDIPTLEPLRKWRLHTQVETFEEFSVCLWTTDREQHLLLWAAVDALVKAGAALSWFQGKKTQDGISKALSILKKFFLANSVRDYQIFCNRYSDTATSCRNVATN